MIDLNDLRVLIKVVEAHSFSRAADVLKIPVSSVSSRVSRLERAVGTRLLERTTRKLRLTEAGHRLYVQALRSLAEIDEVTGNAARPEEQIRGQVRVSTTSAIAQGVIAALVPAFLNLHPQVNLHVDTNSRRVDLIEEDFDVAIRLGDLPSNRLVGKALGKLRARLYGSPSVVAGTGLPAHPRELDGLALLDMGNRREQSSWRLRHDDGEETYDLRFTPRLSSLDEQLMLRAALAGLGVVNLPEITAQPWVDQGALVCVLPNWLARELMVSAIVPSRDGMSASARAFIEFLASSWPNTPRVTSPDFL